RASHQRGGGPPASGCATGGDAGEGSAAPRDGPGRDGCGREGGGGGPPRGGARAVPRVQAPRRRSPHEGGQVGATAQVHGDPARTGEVPTPSPVGADGAPQTPADLDLLCELVLNETSEEIPETTRGLTAALEPWQSIPVTLEAYRSHGEQASRTESASPKRP